MDASTSVSLESMELAVIASLLDLDEFEVVQVAADRKTRLRTFTLIPKVSAGLCPHCQGVSDERHACRDRTVMDLPMGGWRTALVVRLWQFHCRACDRYFTPAFASLAEGSHATERLLDRLAELVDHGDLSSAARFFHIPEKTAEAWYYAHTTRRRRETPTAPLQPIKSLGIDELSLKKDTGNSAAC